MKKIYFILLMFFLAFGVIIPKTTFAAAETTNTGTYISLKYPDTTKSGRIWFPPNANGSLPIFILLHGSIPTSGTSEAYDSNTSAYLGPNAKSRIDGITLQLIKNGELPNIILASPIDGQNTNEAAFHSNRGFDFDEYINKIDQELQTHGVSIDRSKIILGGHSNGGSDSNRGGIYHTLTSPTRSTPIFAAVQLDAGITGLGAKHFENIPGQKPPNVVALAARNASGAEAWKTKMLKANPQTIPCNTNFFKSNQCLVSADGHTLFYQAKSTSSKAHKDVIPEFIKGALPRILGFEGVAVPPGGFGKGPENTSPTNIRDEVKNFLRKPEVLIRIPGLNFSSVTDIVRTVNQDPSGKYFLSIPFLGEYISAIYQLAIATISILAMIMIVVSGIMWTVSGGNSERIAKAQARIAQATFGLIIALGSYTILLLVNPALVRFDNLRLLYVEREELHVFNENVQPAGYYPANGPTGELDPSVTPVKVAQKGFNDVPLFLQGRGPWRRLTYGDGELPACEGSNSDRPPDVTCCTMMAFSACGPTALAMVLRHYNKPVDPRHTAALAVQTKARRCNLGTALGSGNLIKEVKSKYNLKYDIISGNLNQLQQILLSGQPLIANGAQSGHMENGKIKSYKGHYIVYTGIGTHSHNGTDQKVVFINDPAGPVKYKLMSEFEAEVAKGKKYFYVRP